MIRLKNPIWAFYYKWALSDLLLRIPLSDKSNGWIYVSTSHQTDVNNLHARCFFKKHYRKKNGNKDAVFSKK